MSKSKLSLVKMARGMRGGGRSSTTSFIRRAFNKARRKERIELEDGEVAVVQKPRELFDYVDQYELLEDFYCIEYGFGHPFN